MVYSHSFPYTSFLSSFSTTFPLPLLSLRSSPPHLSPLTSMPYAQSHYPFENKKAFEAAFPADFIAEGIDQTRGW